MRAPHYFLSQSCQTALQHIHVLFFEIFYHDFGGFPLSPHERGEEIHHGVYLNIPPQAEEGVDLPLLGELVPIFRLPENPGGLNGCC